MKKLTLLVFVLGLVGAPVTSHAAPDGCALAKKLGIVFVRECGDPRP